MKKGLGNILNASNAAKEFLKEKTSNDEAFDSDEDDEDEDDEEIPENEYSQDDDEDIPEKSIPKMKTKMIFQRMRCWKRTVSLKVP